MTSWKSTVSGIVTAAAGFVVFSPGLFSRWPWVVEAAKYVMAGGVAMLGIVSKDSDVHSTDTEVRVATNDAHIEATKDAMRLRS